MPRPARRAPTSAPGPGGLLARLDRVAPAVRSALAASVAAGLVAVGATVAQAVALARLLTDALARPGAGVGSAAALLAGTTVVRALGAGLAEPAIGRLAAPLRRALRHRALERVLDGGPTGGPDATVQLATRGVEAVEEYVARALPTLVLGGLAPLALLGWLAWRDPLSAVVVAVAIGLLPVFMVLLGLAAREEMTHRFEDLQRLAGYFGDVVRGMAVLRAHNRARAALDALESAGEALTGSTMRTLRVAFLSGLALELLSSLATALVALVLGLRLLEGSLSLAVALAVLLVTPEVFVPLRRAAAQYHASADGLAAAAALLERVGAPPPPGTAPAPGAAPRLVLEGVRLGRPGRPAPSAPVAMDVPPGALCVVHGPSGVGKTTLLRTLAGLSAPLAGRVLVDGVDLAAIDPEGWRDRVAWVPQDPRLPGRTVAEALDPGGTLGAGALAAALERVGLSHLDPGRPLGEGAATLSAGERRRLALARALARDPLVLILDEPTAHLDARGAREVEEVVAALPGTRVVATHRPFPGDVLVSLEGEAVGAR